MKKKNRKKKPNYALLLHIVIAILILLIGFMLFTVVGQRDVDKIVKTTGELYKERIDDVEKLARENVLNKELQKQLQPFQKHRFNYIYTLTATGNVKNFIFQVPLPSDESEKQYISSLQITPKPTRVYHNGINNIAEYKFDRVSSGQMDVSISGVANVRTYDLTTAKILSKNIGKEKELSQYLKPSFFIESDDAVVKNIAKGIKGKTQEEIVRNIYDYIQKNIKYTPLPSDIGAKAALKQKQGKCSEYAAAMVALCRAKKIPARIVCGNIARETFQKHSWVEVYFDRYGWVAFDPTTMGSVVNIYNNGKLVRREARINSDKSHLNYIASSRNDFSPWYISYSIADSINSNVLVSEKIIIKNVK